MVVRLNPELEALIQQDVERGDYQSADEFVERAVQMLHDQEQWFADNRTEIMEKISAGLASANRGDLLDPGQVRAQLAERKKAFLSANK